MLSEELLVVSHNHQSHPELALYVFQEVRSVLQEVS
jgi:hypothetical protein